MGCAVMIHDGLCGRRINHDCIRKSGLTTSSLRMTAQNIAAIMHDRRFLGDAYSPEFC